WRAIEATHVEGGPRLANFVHVPLVPRSSTERHAPGRMTFEHLVDAGEAMLMEMARLARHQAAGFLAANPSGSHTGS
ncbi:hypothetical protein LZT49_12700, partial [Enterococcus hirae]